MSKYQPNEYGLNMCGSIMCGLVRLEKRRSAASGVRRGWKRASPGRGGNDSPGILFKPFTSKIALTLIR